MHLNSPFDKMFVLYYRIFLLYMSRLPIEKIHANEYEMMRECEQPEMILVSDY